MRRTGLTLLLLALFIGPAVAQMVLIDAQLAAPSDSAAARRHLALLEGSAMEPFFDSGHIVFDSPASEAAELGASLVLVVVLELDVTDERSLPQAVGFELIRVRDGEIVSAGTVTAASLGDDLTADERSVALGAAAAEQAISGWADSKETDS